MNKNKNRISRKLKSNAGESIAETLIALLIAALALVMLASMISTTVSLVTKSKQTMSDYYDTGNAILEQPTANTENITVNTNVDASVKTVSAGSADTFSASPKVTVYSNNVFSGIPVISYTAASNAQIG